MPKRESTKDRSGPIIPVERDIDAGIARIHICSDKKKTLNVQAEQRRGKKQMVMVRSSNDKKDKPKSSSYRPTHTTSKEVSRHVHRERNVVPEVEEAGVEDDDKPATVPRIEWKGSSYSSYGDPRKPDGRFP